MDPLGRLEVADVEEAEDLVDGGLVGLQFVAVGDGPLGASEGGEGEECQLGKGARLVVCEAPNGFPSDGEGILRGCEFLTA